MNVHWQEKKKDQNMSNPKIDNWYSGALKNGNRWQTSRIGGVFIFYIQQRKLRAYFKKQKLSKARSKFDFEGSKLII